MPITSSRALESFALIGAPRGLLLTRTGYLRSISSNCQLVMDSVPQEITDEIINNLPDRSLRFTSLVAKRWRERSLRRFFCRIWFHSESKVNRWHTDIQSNPGGVSSYIRFAGFRSITEWKDPALFGRVLGNPDSLTTLAISDTVISDEMLGYISHGELGGITALDLCGPRYSPSTVMALILAFPNLRDLIVIDLAIRVGPEEPSTHSAPPQRIPLDSLLVRQYGNVPIAEALAYHRFASRRLTLDAQPQNIQKLLALSSVTVVELVIIGMCSSW